MYCDECKDQAASEKGNLQEEIVRLKACLSASEEVRDANFKAKDRAFIQLSEEKAKFKAYYDASVEAGLSFARKVQDRDLQNEELKMALRNLIKAARDSRLDERLKGHLRVDDIVDADQILCKYTEKLVASSPNCPDCEHDDVTLGSCKTLPLPYTDSRMPWKELHCAKCCSHPEKWKPA